MELDGRTPAPSDPQICISLQKHNSWRGWSWNKPETPAGCQNMQRSQHIYDAGCIKAWLRRKEGPSSFFASSDSNLQMSYSRSTFLKHVKCKADSNLS